MAHKKPSPAPLPAAKPTRPEAPHGAPKAKSPFADNPRLQADNRWQRTKRYGWNSR